MTVAIFDPKVHWRSVKTAASNYAPGLHLQECRSAEEWISTRNRVFLRSRGIGLPFVREELPNIPRHIEKAVSIGGIRAHRRGGIQMAAGIVRASSIHRLVPPREERIQATTSSIFPLRFGWQALPGPAAIRHRRIPVHIHYRMICLRDECVRCFPMLEVSAGVKFRRNAVWLPLGIRISKPLELRGCHQVLVQIEVVEDDPVFWDLILK